MKVAIIVAAGSGKRFGTSIPKQFLMLNGKPVLAYSIETFFQSGAHVMVVLSADMVDFWKEQSQRYQLPEHQIVMGGAERYHSVQNAIAQIPEGCELVAIHDAARPGIDLPFVERMWQSATIHGTAIPFWPISDSLRCEQNGVWNILDRNKVRSIQTPQCFQFEVVKNAYGKTYSEKFTDDASVVESDGEVNLHFELGLHRNTKITHADDLSVMEMLFNQSKI
jgi:2-C-methyl-D-erythritol 4-phosphate cytidylyltransferase